MNKNGTIVLLDNDIANGNVLCNGLKKLGHKNEVLCFDDAQAVSSYLHENVLDVFMVLQNSTSPGVQVPDTRNMVFMHESFKTDTTPFMFIVLTKDRLLSGSLHTFVHCYYRPAALNQITETLAGVIAFWKDHVFPPKITKHQ